MKKLIKHIKSQEHELWQATKSAFYSAFVASICAAITISIFLLFGGDLKKAKECIIAESIVNVDDSATK